MDKYQHFISGKRGWNEFCDARHIDPDGLDVQTADNIARYIYWRTNGLSLWESTGA